MKKIIFKSTIFLILFKIQFTTQKSQHEDTYLEVQESEHQSKDQIPSLQHHKPDQYGHEIGTSTEIQPALLFLGSTVVRLTTMAAIIGAIYLVKTKKKSK